MTGAIERLTCHFCRGWVTWRGWGWKCGVCRHEWRLIDEDADQQLAIEREVTR